MNKENVFCSSSFDMSAGDVLHILFIDESGDNFTFELSNPDEEDGPPSAPTALPSTDEDGDSFTANWYYNENTEGYALDVAYDEEFTSFVTGFEDLDVGNVDSYSVTGLIASSTYYYRVRAYNSYGTSDNSNVITVLTGIDLLYGALYNWYAVMNANFAPTGWHVATPAEWNTLKAAVGGAAVAGGHLKKTGTVYWISPNTGADDSSGFSAVASGNRLAVDNGSFNFRGYGETYHTTAYIGGHPENGIALANSSASWGSGYVTDEATAKMMGRPMRLIKNDSTDPGTVTDYDGIVYDTVKIGSQVWTKQNFRCTHYNNGVAIPVITDGPTWDADTTGAMCWYNNIAP